MTDGPGPPPGGIDGAPPDSVESENTELRAALARSEDTIRRFPAPFIVLDRDCDIVTWNRGAERVFGYTADEMVARSYLDLIPEAAHPDERDRLARALEGDPVHPALVERIGKDGQVFPVLSEVECVPAGEDVRLAVSDRDLSARVEAERDRQVLRRELDHRVKNVLTMVQGFLDQALTASDGSVEGFASASRERVGALSIAHQAMAAHDGDGAGLRRLTALTLGALDLKDRVSVQGEELTIPGFSVPPLAMAVHELAANAVQHGALSEPEGRVDLRWTVEPDDLLRIIWEETGGPPVSAARRPGFGTRLIEEGIPYEIGGTARIDLRPEGLRCEIRFPLRARSR